MKIYLPNRKERVLTMPLFCRVNPLMRPRLNKHKNNIYQPKENQVELLNEIVNYGGKAIDYPCFVDVWIQLLPDKEFELSYHAIDKQFGDVDNLLKAVYDALVFHKVLTDDRFIVGADVRKTLGQDDFCYVTIWSSENGVTELHV
jgi:Holliday junction resolvase RusA-like endonuclease